MKAFLLTALLATVAQAETITLDGPVGCGPTAQCHDVPNDKGYVIDLFYSPSDGHSSVFIDGELIAADVSVEFQTTRVQVNSGRLHYWQTRYYLVGGTITR